MKKDGGCGYQGLLVMVLGMWYHMDKRERETTKIEKYFGRIDNWIRKRKESS